MPGHWSYIALALYLASLALYGRFLYTGRQATGRLATLALGLGIVSHYLALLERSHWVRSVPYDDIYGALSLFGFLLAVTYLGLERYYHLRSMGAFVTRQEHGPLFAFHVTLSILAYAAFALAFVLSLVYLLQDRRLRHRRPGPVVWRFPPLDALERMSRGSVRVGLLSLTVGTVLGVIWQWKIRGHFLVTDPKVLITVVILLLYGGYLWLSRTASGRGARASVLCVLNFVLVIFSYVVVNLYLSQFHKYL
jgi:ABC-type uncharacterized transport system permease subunit